MKVETPALTWERGALERRLSSVGKAMLLLGFLLATRGDRDVGRLIAISALLGPLLIATSYFLMLVGAPGDDEDERLEKAFVKLARERR
jgi:hypothetical protein